MAGFEGRVINIVHAHSWPDEIVTELTQGKDLIHRWAREPWLTLGPRIHTLLGKGRRLDDPEIPNHEGRLDLRGLPFPRRGRWGSFPWFPELQPASSDLPVIEKPLATFKGASVAGVDLSFADLENTNWENCKFRDVHARSANLSHCVFSGCGFEDVRLDEANLNSAVLGGFTGYETNTFRRVSFVKADLRHTNYRFPLFEDCDFSRAKFARVNFEASRFVRCRFAGKLGGTEFHGSADLWYEIGHDREYFIRRGITPQDIRNTMQDVDFGEADLNGVTFWGVDLSHCKLPADDKHVIVRDPRLFYERTRVALEHGWEAQEREEALDLLDMLIGPGDRFLKKIAGEGPGTILEGERRRIDKPSHWRATRPMVLSRGFFQSKSRPWGGRLFDLLIQLSREL